MCKTLAELATDPKVPPSERRRAAMDLISVGSGRPALVQEIGGRGGAPLAPLVNLNLNSGGSTEQLYQAAMQPDADLAAILGLVTRKPAAAVPASGTTVDVTPEAP